MIETTQSTCNTDAVMSDPSSGSDSNSQAASPATQAPQASRPPVEDQPSTAYLEGMGLRIRDFAYESTLPPVRTYRIQATQIQPAPPRPLTRESTEPDHDSQSQGQQLERRPTEPAITPVAPPARKPAFANLEDVIVDPQEPSANGAGNANTNSSLQRDSSQDPTSDLYPYALPGHSARLSQQSEGYTSSQQSTTTPSSPLTSLPSSPVPHVQYSTISHRTNSMQELRSPVIPRVLQPRYALRKRPAPTMSTIPSPKPSKRARIKAPSDSPLKSRPQSASQPKRKSKDNANSGSRNPSKRACNDRTDKRQRT